MHSERQMAMSTFMANVFDNARTAYVFPLLSQISAILKSDTSAVARRRNPERRSRAFTVSGISTCAMYSPKQWCIPWPKNR